MAEIDYQALAKAMFTGGGMSVALIARWDELPDREHKVWRIFANLAIDALHDQGFVVVTRDDVSKVAPKTN